MEVIVKFALSHKGRSFIEYPGRQTNERRYLGHKDGRVQLRVQHWTWHMGSIGGDDRRRWRRQQQKTRYLTWLHRHSRTCDVRMPHTSYCTTHSPHNSAISLLILWSNHGQNLQMHVLKVLWRIQLQIYHQVHCWGPYTARLRDPSNRLNFEHQSHRILQTEDLQNITSPF